MRSDKDGQATPQEMREATLWKVLRASYLRVICDFMGKLPADLKVEEENMLLNPWFRFMELDLVRINEVIWSAQSDAASEVRGLLHSSQVDRFSSDELMDEALEYAKEPTVEAPLMDLPKHVEVKGG